jgi:hypothetical protein
VLLHGWFVRHPLRILCPLSTAQESNMNLTAFGLASLIGMAATAPVAAAEPAHPTIRHMAGAPVATSLDAAKTAVLVIDFQNEYFDATAAPGFAGGRMVIPDGVAALRQAKRVVEFADAHGIRVIHVQHVLPAGAPLFAQGSVNAAFHRDLQPRQGETVVQKDNVSVFAGAPPPCSTGAEERRHRHPDRHRPADPCLRGWCRARCGGRAAWLPGDRLVRCQRQP